MLEWSRGLGPIHAYVGRTSRGWVEQLQFTGDEIVYPANRRREWLRKLIFGGGHRMLIFDPGEVPLGAAHLKSEVVFLGVVLAVRARGGIVFRPPRADLHIVLGNQTMGRSVNQTDSSPLQLLLHSTLSFVAR